MEHPRTHSLTAAANTPTSTRNSSTSSTKKQQSGSTNSSTTVSNSGNTVGTGTSTTNRSSLSKCSTSNDKVLSNITSENDDDDIDSSGNENGNSNSEPLLHENIVMGSEYTDSVLLSSSNERNIGIITPLNVEPPSVQNEIFKQFDTKTGQFLRDNNLNNQRELSKEPIPPKDKLNQQPLQIKNINENTGNNIPSFRLLSIMRSRSNSVPTILHSSLKRLSNHSHYYRNNNIISNNNNNNNDNTNISTHPMNPYGIIKKKTLRTHQHLLQSNHHHLSSTNLNSSSTALNSSSLRQAILLTQEAINTSSSSSSSSPPGGTNSGNEITKTNTPYLNENVNIQTNNSINGISQTEIIRNINSISSRNRIITFEDRVNYVKQTKLPIALPPINLQCLKEIDLQEIVKNPQLRHDIMFDPLLQFRPNLDGERGIKKKHLSDVYWRDVENELIVYSKRPDLFQYDRSRLVPLFDTLRDVLLTIVPQKEAHQISNILDTELNVQELIKGSLVMTNLSDWLATLFKHHCAPMRDSYVDKMSNKFKEAELESSLPKLMEGLKLVFQILEAMKLDIANHQIRLLRPALLSNAVEFEKQYFNSLMQSRNVLLKSSLFWFNNKFNEYINSNQIVVKDKENVTIPEVYKCSIKSIIGLLSCRKMVREFPTSLSFDHARLILLRADIRQLVCLLVCRLLFQQLVANDNTIDKPAKLFINTTYSNKRLKDEIISIITDEHGNCRWTKNTLSISVHLCKVIDDLKNEFSNKQKLESQHNDDDEDITMEGTEQENITPVRINNGLPPALDNEKIRFAKAWLSKQTQPLSEVYAVLENRVFKSLEEGIYGKSGCTIEGRVKQDFVYLYNSIASGGSADTAATVKGVNAMNTNISFKSSQGSTATDSDSNTNKPTNSNTGLFAFADSEEFENVYRHLYTVINLHWSVFGAHYIDSLGDKLATRGL